VKLKRAPGLPPCLIDLFLSLITLCCTIAFCGCAVVPPTITTQPISQTVAVGQSATFSITATGSGPLRYQWKKGTTSIPGATAASYTTTATTASDNGLQFSVVVSGAAKIVATSSIVTLAVVPATDALTYHNDNARTGQNLTEAILTPGNVNAASFGKINFFPVDGFVDAQPLYASNEKIPNNGTHNLLIVATESGSVYAFDADSGNKMWQISTLSAGETTSDDPSPACKSKCPVIGINPTPVIDRTRGPNGAIYVVSASKDLTGNYHQRMHALDLAFGTELFGGPVEIQATYPGTGDNSDGTNVVFDPMQYRERAALLLLNGIVYTSWASHYDNRPYTGWVIGYDASTLAQASVLNVTPNGSAGAIWMSGGGLASDTSGNIYFADANGDFDDTLDANGFPSRGNYGNALIKLSTSGGTSVADYFEMYDEAQENAEDMDLGSGGIMVLPDLGDGTGGTQHLAVGAGKDSNIYVINRDSMGKYTTNNANIYQELVGVLPGGIWGSPAYFNNTVYYGPVESPLQAFSITNARLSGKAAAQSLNSFGYPGTSPSISANGKNNGIVWAFENAAVAVLHAYDPDTLNEIYNSSQSGKRDLFGWGNKFVTPLIVNGKVYVGTPSGVAVFGLLASSPAAQQNP
jgi:PQQ enzyme repeat